MTAKFALGTLVVTSGLVIVAGQVLWLKVDFGDFWNTEVYARDGSLSFLLIATAIAYGVGAGVLLWAPSRIVAVMLAAVADLWLVVLALAGAATLTAQRLLEDAYNGAYSLAQAIDLLGISTTGGVIRAPGWMDLTSLGYPDNTVPVADFDMSQSVPEVVIDVSSGAWIVIVAAILVHAVGLFVLSSADRAARKLRIAET